MGVCPEQHQEDCCHGVHTLVVIVVDNISETDETVKLMKFVNLRSLGGDGEVEGVCNIAA